MAARGDIRIGISGWRYAPWRGVLYPKGLRQKDELSFASRRRSSSRFQNLRCGSGNLCIIMTNTGGDDEAPSKRRAKAVCNRFTLVEMRETSGKAMSAPCDRFRVFGQIRRVFVGVSIAKQDDHRTRKKSAQIRATTLVQKASSR
jgi:hypothetical protein